MTTTQTANVGCAVTIGEYTQRREVGLVLDACAANRLACSKQRARSTAPAKSTAMGKFEITAKEASKLRFVVARNGRLTHVRDYEFTVTALDDIQLIGRRVEIDEGPIFEHVPWPGSMSPTVGGEDNPIIKAGAKPLSFKVGVATDARYPKHITLEIYAKRLTGDTAPFRVRKTLEFPRRLEDEEVKAFEIGESRLDREQAKILRAWVRAHIAQAKTKGRAVFRADTIEGLSVTSRNLVNGFLFDEQRRDNRKKRTFDFAPVLPRGIYCPKLNTTDHYILPKMGDDGTQLFELTVVLDYNNNNLDHLEEDKGALFDLVRTLIEKYGFHNVAKEVAGQVPPGDSALSGMVPDALHQHTRAPKANKPKVVLPELPPDLSWPTQQYKNAAKGVDIIEFLGEITCWAALIKAGYGELRYLRLIDASAVTAIKNFKKDNAKKDSAQRKTWPEHLHFLTEKEVTDRKLVKEGIDGLRGDPRLAATVAARVARGTKVPRF